MSFDAAAWAFKQTIDAPQECSRAAAKLTLIALADHYNKDTALCCPKQSTLIEEVGLSERTVRRAITTLERQGLISVEPTRNGHQRGVNRYILHMNPQPQLQPAKMADDLPAKVAAQEPGSRPEPGRNIQKASPSSPRQARKRDERYALLFQAIEETCEANPSLQTRRWASWAGDAAWQLYDVGCTGQDVQDFAAAWHQAGRSELNPTVITKHMPAFMQRGKQIPEFNLRQKPLVDRLAELAMKGDDLGQEPSSDAGQPSVRGVPTEAGSRDDRRGFRRSVPPRYA